MNAIVTDKKVISSGAQWTKIGDIEYYLFILPTGTIFQTDEVYGYSPIMFLDIDIPAGKTISMARIGTTNINYYWDTTEYTNTLNQKLYYNNDTGKYFFYFNNTSPMPKGYNFRIGNYPFMTILQAT